MSTRHSRRYFLKSTAAGAAVAAGAGIFTRPALVRAQVDTKKLRIAVIGCGGQGTNSHVPPAVRESLVAIVDADQKRHSKAFDSAKNFVEKAKKDDITFNPDKCRTFTDYRTLFDAMGKDLDAVLIATPNHHHALPALLAMSRGIAAYVEKPLAYDIAEIRKLADFSVKYKVTTQMGNQGHTGEGYRRLCEYIWAGAIGDVTEVYCWTDRANGGEGGRPPTLPVPAGMNWDNWIGPAPYRDFHKDLHPHEWHNWFDFGGGSIGNMGCHVMDGAHWALKLGHPTSIVLEDAGGGSAEQFTTTTRIRYDFAARGNMPALKLYWYDGKKKGAGEVAQGDIVGSVKEDVQNWPPIVAEWAKKTGRKFDGSGTFYIGTKGVMYTATYGNAVRIIPEEQHKATPIPTPTLPRLKGDHHEDFYRSIRAGVPACSNFVDAAKLTELILLGGLAIRAGVGTKIEWDGERCTNNEKLNHYLQRDYRKGWEV